MFVSAMTVYRSDSDGTCLSKKISHCHQAAAINHLQAYSEKLRGAAWTEYGCCRASFTLPWSRQLFTLHNEGAVSNQKKKNCHCHRAPVINQLQADSEDYVQQELQHCWVETKMIQIFNNKDQREVYNMLKKLETFQASSTYYILPFGLCC